MYRYMLPDRVNMGENKITEKICVFNSIGELIGELSHAALHDVAGSKDCSNLYSVSIQGDKMVVCGIGGVALFRLGMSM